MRRVLEVEGQSRGREFGVRISLVKVSRRKLKRELRAFDADGRRNCAGRAKSSRWRIRPPQASARRRTARRTWPPQLGDVRQADGMIVRGIQAPPPPPPPSPPPPPPPHPPPPPPPVMARSLLATCLRGYRAALGGSVSDRARRESVLLDVGAMGTTKPAHWCSAVMGEIYTGDFWKSAEKWRLPHPALDLAKKKGKGNESERE